MDATVNINWKRRSMSQSVLKVVLKGEDWTFTRKYLMYETYNLDENDPHVKTCLDDARECLKLIPDDEVFNIAKVVR